MNKRKLGIIIGGIFGVGLVLLFGPIFGGLGTPFLDTLYQVLIFPMVLLGFVVGGLGNIPGGIVLGFILTIGMYSFIGFHVGNYFEKRGMGS